MPVVAVLAVAPNQIGLVVGGPGAITEEVFSNTAAGRRRLIRRLSSLSEPARPRVFLIAQADLWCSLYSALIQEGFTVEVINPYAPVVPRTDRPLEQARALIASCSSSRSLPVEDRLTESEVGYLLEEVLSLARRKGAVGSAVFRWIGATVVTAILLLACLADAAAVVLRGRNRRVCHGGRQPTARVEG